MIAKGFYVLLLLLATGGIAVGKDRDVWGSNLEKGMASQGILEVRFDRPAKTWTDALPIGNGRLGAMIWGCLANETINLNVDTLWTGAPGNYTDFGARNVLPEVRSLVDKGQYAEASAVAAKLSGHSSDVYQPLGDIKLEFGDSHATYDEGTYERVLDLDTAVVTMRYSSNGVEYTREHFVSHPDNVAVMKIAVSKPSSLNFTLYLDSRIHHRSYVNNESQIVLEGGCSGLRIPPLVWGSNPKIKRRPKPTDNGHPKGIQFSAVLDLQTSDNECKLRAEEDGRRLRVESCTWVVIRLTAASSFEGPDKKPVDSKRDPNLESVRMMDSAKGYSYSGLYARHVNDYQTLFHRVSLHLSKGSENASESTKMTTAERVKSFQVYEDPSTVELLFQYGRYLLIACSRPGSQAANLQGIWSKDVEPPWDCAPHLNINLQMNYWPSLPGNLNECQEPLFDYISSLSINGEKTAKVNYGTRGWVAHQISDLWAKSDPDYGQPVWALWPMGGAWLCTHLWEHYTYTLDKGFLRNKAYPLMEGCALFLLDWLIEGSGDFLETNPSTSPEHMFIAPDGKRACVSNSTAMDMEIIREIFFSIISAAEELGKSNDDLIARVRKTLPRLPPTRITKDGCIMEWALEFEDPEVHHRHLSHLFGLFPGHTMTLESTPDLCKAAEKSLLKRGEDGPGWSTVWKTALWARLHNSEHAYRMVKHLFDLVDPNHESSFEGGLYANLFTAHPPFQIDANFGFTAAVTEMLVQSTVKDLYLLPALPRDIWGSGCVKGVKARGGVTISMCWSNGNLHEFGVWSDAGNTVKKLHYRGTTATANILAGFVYTYDRNLNCIDTYPLWHRLMIGA